MGRYTIEQRVKVIQAYYENGRSNQNAYRALRDCFGQFNRPNVRTIGKIVQKFEQTGSVGDVKTPVHARTARTAENIAAVRDSVAEEPSTSIRRRAQQLHLSRSSLMNIMHKDLHLHAYKDQLTQELKPLDHRLHHCAAVNFVPRIPFTEDFFFCQLFDTVSSTYTYLLADTNSKEAVIIDPVLEHAKRDATLIKELGFDLKYAMNTHMHADHITGTGYLKELIPGVKSVISEASGAKADEHLKEGNEVTFGCHKILAVSTPGHTNGCMSYIIHKQGIIFTGDTVLIRGCGRTDFQEGDSRKLYESVHSKIFSLPENYRIYPAHDYKGQLESTVFEEKTYNPRLTKDIETFVEIMDNLNLPYPKMIDKAVPANRECGLHDIPK